MILHTLLFVSWSWLWGTSSGFYEWILLNIKLMYPGLGLIKYYECTSFCGKIQLLGACRASLLQHMVWIRLLSQWLHWAHEAGLGDWLPCMDTCSNTAQNMFQFRTLMPCWHYGIHNYFTAHSWGLTSFLEIVVPKLITI